MKPWILNSDARGFAYNNIWRLTPSGDLAFWPGSVAEVTTKTLVPTVRTPVSAQPEVAVLDIDGNVVRSQICDTDDNPFSVNTHWSHLCGWGHDFSTSRADYNQDTEICVKFMNFYDLRAAANSFNGGVDDTGILSFSTHRDSDFAPSFETGAFDQESYFLGGRGYYGGWSSYSTSGPVTLNGVNGYYQVNMQNFKKLDTMTYKPGSTTEYSEDSIVQTPIFCERLNSVYIGTITIFSLTMILWIGKIFTQTATMITNPDARYETAIDFPFVGALLPFIMLAFPSSKKKLTEIEKKKQNEEKSILYRVLGLRWLSTELPCGAFTFTSTLCDKNRWLEYGTLDTDGNPRESVKFWEAVCYPLILPFTSTYWKAISCKRERNCFVKFMYYMFVWPVPWVWALGTWPVHLVSVLLVGTFSIVFFSDHSITIKLIEDFPQMVLAYYYSTQVRYNNEAIFSATLSLLVLTRTIIMIVLSIKKEAVTEFKQLNKQEEQKLHRLYGDLSLGQMVWVTVSVPWTFGWFYAWNFPLLVYGVNVRKKKVEPKPNPKRIAPATADMERPAATESHA
jgi:hypothetical protein